MDVRRGERGFLQNLPFSMLMFLSYIHLDPPIVNLRIIRFSLGIVSPGALPSGANFQICAILTTWGFALDAYSAKLHQGPRGR